MALRQSHVTPHTQFSYCNMDLQNEQDSTHFVATVTTQHSHHWYEDSKEAEYRTLKDFIREGNSHLPILCTLVHALHTLHTCIHFAN